MKKSIFYPNLSIQGEVTTEEEYEGSLLKLYQQKYQNVDIFYISTIISFVLYRVYTGVGLTFGCFQNASVLADNIKTVAGFERNLIIEICDKDRLSDNFFTLCVFYKGSIEDMKFDLEKKKIPYSDEIAAIAQEITKKIIDDIGSTTRSQLTFVEKYTKKPGENKVQWANRVYNSSTENLTTTKDVNRAKSVQFGSDRPTIIGGQTGIVK